MLIIDTVAAITTMHVICIVIVPIKKLNYPLYLDDDVFTLLQCPSDTINKAKFMKYTGLGTFLFAFYTLTCYKCYTTKYSFPVTTGKGKNAKPVADQPCWFDLKRNDCAKCKPGGVQCGAPMEKVTTQCICICDCICSCVCKLFSYCICSGARARSQRRDVREFLSSSTLAHPPASPATGILRGNSPTSPSPSSTPTLSTSSASSAPGV